MKEKQKPVAAMEALRQLPIADLIGSLRLSSTTTTVQVTPEGIKVQLTIPWQFHPEKKDAGTDPAV